MLGGCLHLAPQGPGQRPAYHLGDAFTSTPPPTFISASDKQLGQAVRTCPHELRQGSSCPLLSCREVGSGLAGSWSADQTGCMSVHLSTWILRVVGVELCPSAGSILSPLL